MLTLSPNHIDALINWGKENAWQFTSFYGAPETHQRIDSWNLLRDLHRRFPLPWLCAGDFNELSKSHEKLKGHLRHYGQMKIFQEALDECGLMDLDFVSNKFTWFKNYLNGVTMWEWLDRAIGTTEWFALFQATKFLSFDCQSYDHKPLLILPGGIVVAFWTSMA